MFYYDLYHNLDPNLLDPERSGLLWFLQRDKYFSRVAKIHAPLSRIFELSNHILDEEDWATNAEVVWHVLSPLRSTGVGDVIVTANPPFSPRGCRSRIASARVQLVPLLAWLVTRVGLKELKGVSR